MGFDLSRFNTNKEEKRKNFRNQFNIDDDELAIGIIGRLVPIKNHQLFINAIDSIRKTSSKKIRAFIVGDGDERESLKAYSASLGIDYLNGDFSGKEKATLHFTSWIKEVDIVNAGMDIIALSSLNEGTPVSLIEAQAAGKPIVSTNVGGVENIVIENETALLAPNNDLGAFTSQLSRLVESEAMRETMSQKGWDFVHQQFHFSRLVDDMKNLYNNLLSS